jgi:hypothetical protein
MRNLAVKVPEDLWPEFKARATAACQAPSRKFAREGRRLDHDYQAAYRLDTGRSGDTPAARIPSRSRT